MLVQNITLLIVCFSLSHTSFCWSEEETYIDTYFEETVNLSSGETYATTQVNKVKKLKNNTHTHTHTRKIYPITEGVYYGACGYNSECFANGTC
jgi:hypothetical protein